MNRRTFSQLSAGGLGSLLFLNPSLASIRLKPRMALQLWTVRDLIKEGGLYTIANLATKGISLLLLPFYTAYFTTQDYGVIEILMVFGGGSCTAL